MPTPSGRWINCTNCVFTPAVGNPYPITGVVSMQVTQNGRTIKASGDAEVFNSTVATVMNDPTIVLQSNRPGLFDALPDGSRGVFTCDVPDAVNGLSTGGGGRRYQLSPCHVEGVGSNHQHQNFSAGQIGFVGYAPDGVTNPLTITNL